MKSVTKLLTLAALLILSNVSFCAYTQCVPTEKIMDYPDTITVGDHYKGKQYDRMGYYPQEREVLTDTKGCDSITVHKLVVLPSTKKNEYYVSVNGRGNQSGDSWENAMNDTTFAFALQQVPAKSVFYIEVGTYHPIDVFQEDEGLNLRFRVANPIQLLGGYHPQDFEDKTVFSGDLDDDGSPDVRCIVSANFQSGGDFVLSDIEMSQVVTDATNGPCLNVSSNNTGLKIKIERCSFSRAPMGISFCNAYTEISDCFFYQNNITAIHDYNSKISICNVTKCLFEGNNYTFYTYNDNLNMTCSNCTFIDNYSIKLPALFNLYNNTIIGGSIDIRDNSSADIVGNILNADILIGSDFQCNARYNVCTNKIGYMLKGEYNVTTSEFGSFLDSGITNGEETFKLNWNGGNTRTIALTNDVTKDGSSLRLPLQETIVTCDQRNQTRTKKTCMGAYEISCIPQKTELYEEDTLFVGEMCSFDKQVYSKIGYYTGVPEYFVDETGCDSIVYHKLVVIPDSFQTEFYVKEVECGAGDGSDWDNAMGNESFNIALQYAPQGSTFYMEVGTYHPIDYKNNVYYKASLSMNASNPFTLIGGFHATDESSHTIFTGDIDGDGSADVRTIIQVSNTSDGDISISNVLFENTVNDAGSGSCVEVSSGYESSFKLHRCVFSRTTNGCTMNLEDNQAEVSECQFQYIGLAGLQISGNTSCSISSCSFYQNNNSLLTGENANISVVNSTFLNCERHTLPAQFDFYNNTIIGGEFGIPNNGEGRFTGNIFSASVTTNGEIKCTSSYNVYELSSNNILRQETDIESSDFTHFLKTTTTDDGETVFDLTMNGGATPTIALISDSTIGGKTIRFPLEKTTEKYDQRGAKRLKMTTAGAFEFGCESIETIDDKIDTIYVGTSYLGAKYEKTGEYNVEETFISKYGCDSIVSHKLIVIEEIYSIPDVFTPGEQNGKNDVFMLGHEVYIYDLYGNLICHSSNGWDGYYKGKLASYGVYVYVLITTTGGKKKGTIELLNTQK